MNNQAQKDSILKIDHGFLTHLTVSSEQVDNLIMEGGEEYYNYVNMLGLAKSKMIILSSKHHYYYDAEEISNAKTIVHLKELNHVKQIRDLLNSLMLSLPENCNLIGSFVDNNKFGRFNLKNHINLLENIKTSEEAGLGIVSRNPFINAIYNILDLKTNSYLTKEIITVLLKEFNFEVLDMTESNERIFFHSRKFKQSCN